MADLSDKPCLAQVALDWLRLTIQKAVRVHLSSNHRSLLTVFAFVKHLLALRKHVFLNICSWLTAQLAREELRLC